MADNAIIGALRVILGADTSAFDKGLKQARSGIAEWAKSVSEVAGGISLNEGIEKAVDALVEGIKGGIEQADKLGKISQSIGIPVDELSKLNYWFGQNDLSSDQLSTSLGKLSKNMVAFAGGGAGPATEAFKALGIQVTNSDGSLKSSSEVISEVAEKFASYRDGAAKTALAVALFGKEGAALIPMLNQGSDGLEDASDEAEKFGLVLDRQTVKSATEFNDNLTTLGKILDGIVVQVTARMLPALQQFSDQIIDFAKNGDNLQTVTQGIITLFKWLETQVIATKVEFGRFGAEMGALWNLISSFANGPTAFAKAWDDFQGELQKSEQAFADLHKTISDIWADPNEWESQAKSLTALNARVVQLGESWTKVAPPIMQAANAGKDAITQFLAAQAKRIASQNAETDSVGKSVGDQARLKLEYEAQALALAKNIPLTDAQRKSIDAMANSAAQAAMRLQGAQLTQEMLAPWDQRNLKLQQYNQLLTAGVISQDTFSAAALKLQFPNFYSASTAAMDFGANLDRLGTDSINGVASALSSVITGTKSASEAFKEFATSIIAELAQMVLKALLFKAVLALLGFSGGGPVNITGAAGNMAVPTFAGGGSVTGPGSSTSDSIPALLSNGEFVTNAEQTKHNFGLLEAINSGSGPLLQPLAAPKAINGGRAANDNLNGSQQVASPTFQINGLDPKKFYRGDQIEALVDGLIQYQKDGGKILVKAA